METSTPWYALHQPDTVDSPALLVHPERIKANIEKMIRMAGGPERLFVHIKTHKMPAVVNLQQKAGLQHFKCATIAEAEMLAASGAQDILLAYPLTYPKAVRFLNLIQHYPDCHFAFLVEEEANAAMLSELFASQNILANVYIDIDNGMHRSGRDIHDDIFSFFTTLYQLEALQCQGLHVYDGHFHIRDFEERKTQTLEAFQPVERLINQIEAAGYPSPQVIAGGTPTFPIHAENPRVFCSPGTNVLWDIGYANLLPEQDFYWAAVVLTRIISKPQQGLVTTDLGHKSVAAENPLDQRISFLNLPDCQFVSQSEEHLVLKVDNATWNALEIGTALYGIPQHICPTVALYDEVHVIKANEATDRWPVSARQKRINF